MLRRSRDVRSTSPAGYGRHLAQPPPTKHLHQVDFPRRQTVFAEGEPGDRLYIIISGKVKIGRRSPDGRDHLLTIMGPSDMFGELSIFDPGPRGSSATTITKVRAVSMDRDALRVWIADRPEIAEQLLRVLARRLRRTNNDLADLIFTDVPGRVVVGAPQRAGQYLQQLLGDLGAIGDPDAHRVAVHRCRAPFHAVVGSSRAGPGREMRAHRTCRTGP